MGFGTAGLAADPAGVVWWSGVIGGRWTTDLGRDLGAVVEGGMAGPGGP